MLLEYVLGCISYFCVSVTWNKRTQATNLRQLARGNSVAMLDVAVNLQMRMFGKCVWGKKLGCLILFIYVLACIDCFV